jgi:WD40 repeat protein
MASSISGLAITSNRSKRESIAAGTVAGVAAVFQLQAPALVEASNYPDPNLLTLNEHYTAQLFSCQGAVSWVDFSNDGNALLTASADQKARVFEIGSGVEIERIPHNAPVVLVVATEAGILSASQDSVLQITEASKEPIVAREWPTQGACRVETSALSTSEWAWSCAGRIHLSDGKVLGIGEADRNGLVVVQSMYFNRDGSALIWLDKHHTDSSDRLSGKYTFRIHYAVRHDGWIETAELLPPAADSPVMAISPDGSLLAVAFEAETRTDRGNWMIERFSVTSNPLGLHPLELLSTGERPILSLALTSGGDIAAGTVKNSVLYFKRQRNNSPETRLERLLETQRSMNTGAALQNSYPFDQVVTAVAFDSDGKLLAATADQTIWLFKDAETGLSAPDNTPAVKGGAQRFVFSKSGNQVAAIDGRLATFFAFDGKRLAKGLTLLEPGTIQDLVFVDDDSVISSVATGDSLTRIRHDLRISDHERRICIEQREWSALIPDCKELLRQMPPSD